jgi:hypothetical protein
MLAAARQPDIFLIIHGPIQVVPDTEFSLRVLRLMSGFEQCRLAMDGLPVASGLWTICFQTDNPASVWRPECIVLKRNPAGKDPRLEETPSVG